MQLAALREELTEHAGALSRVVDLHASLDPSFTEQAASWLLDVEKSMRRFRRPRASLFASLRAQVTGAADGLVREDVVVETGRSSRKRRRAVAVSCLREGEAALRAEAERIDALFDEARGKMAQLMAVASIQHAIEPPPDGMTTAWLKKTWTELPLIDETRVMYAYLNASLSLLDRLMLLEEVLSSLLARADT
jgi:hypothetical protein